MTSLSIYCRPQEDVWIVAAWVVLLASGTLLLWWVLFGGGATTLSKFSPVINSPRRESTARAFVTFVVAVGSPMLLLVSALDLAGLCSHAYVSSETGL